MFDDAPNLSTGPGEIFSITKALSHLQRPFRTPDMVGVAMRALLPTKAGRTCHDQLTRKHCNGWQALAEGWSQTIFHWPKSYERPYRCAGHPCRTPRSDRSRNLGGLGRRTPKSRVKIFLRANNGGALYGTKRLVLRRHWPIQHLMTAWTGRMEANRSSPPHGAAAAPTWGSALKLSSGMRSGCTATESAHSHPNGCSLQSQSVGQGRVWRPSGFWQGGAAIAAVWYGATVAHTLKALATSSKVASDFRMPPPIWGARWTKALARRPCAAASKPPHMDRHPSNGRHQSQPRCGVRATVDINQRDVLQRATGGTGARDCSCSDAIHAQRCATSPVFLRQSHAEHDLC